MWVHDIEFEVSNNSMMLGGAALELAPTNGMLDNSVVCAKVAPAEIISTAHINCRAKALER
jgi:hypothetical protein